MKVLLRSRGNVRPFIVSVGVSLLAVFAGQALAASAPTAPADSVVVETTNPYAVSSDEELTKLVADWDHFDSDQRRALLAEVKKRMARQGSTDGTLRVRLPRRYGTVVRRGTIHIKIRAVPKERREFGVGFEQRSAQASSAQASIEQPASARALQEQAAPVIKVTDPN